MRAAVAEGEELTGAAKVIAVQGSAGGFVRSIGRAVATVGLTVGATVGVVACGDDEPPEVLRYERVQDGAVTSYDYDIVIPRGTAERIAAGKDVRLLPAEFVVEVGETIRIVNRDVEGHDAGPFYVGPGETMTQRFASEGEYSGVCSVHSSGEIVVRVEPASPG